MQSYLVFMTVSYSQYTWCLCYHKDDLVAMGLSHLVDSQSCQVQWRGGSRQWPPFAVGEWRSSPAPLGPAARTAGERAEGGRGWKPAVTNQNTFTNSSNRNILLRVGGHQCQFDLIWILLLCVNALDRHVPCYTDYCSVIYFWLRFIILPLV